MSRNDWVRVRDDRTGHHITVTEAAAAAQPAYKRLQSRAAGPDGSPLPPKILQRAPKAAGKPRRSGGAKRERKPATPDTNNATTQEES